VVLWLGGCVVVPCVHRDEGRIAVRTRWKEYLPAVEDTPQYSAVKKNTTGSRPRELFEDLILVRAPSPFLLAVLLLVML